ncbi:MAG: cellulase family glycosylhydrolase, partial [Candidatus Bathyarchaeota archaeon]
KGTNVYAGEWYKGTINNQQFIFMKNWGFNTVRITIPSWTIKYNNWQNQTFRQIYLDMIQHAKDNEMYVVVSVMHLDDENIEELYPLDTSVWSAKDWTNYFEHIKNIVTMTKNEDHVLYDLLNEPLYLESYDFYRDKMEQAIDAVRSIDPDAICIVEAGSLGYFGANRMGLQFFDEYPIRRDNIIYSPHIYHDDKWEENMAYSKTDIRSRFQSMNYYAPLNDNKPVWIGEFNTNNDLVGDPTFRGEEFLRNLMDIIEEDGFSGWCIWSWGLIGRHQVINDFNGTPSQTGQVIKDYLMNN